MLYTSEEEPISAFSFRSAFHYSFPNRNYIPIDLKPEFVSEEKKFTKATRKVILLFMYFIVLLFFPISIWFCIKRVHALERLVIFRLGRLQPVIGPGLCFVLPIIDVSIKVDLNPKVYSLPKQQIITADGAIIDILGEIKYCICDVIYFVTKLHKQEDSIKELSMCCFSNVISGKEQYDVENDKELITSYIKAELNKTVINWGIEILEVVILTVKILKEAEHANPLNSVLDVFKTVSHGTNNELLSNFMMPFQQNVNDAQNLSGGSNNHKSLIEFDQDNLIERIQNIADEAAKHVTSDKYESIFKFMIIGQMNSIRNIFITFHEGHPSVFESESESFKSDCTVTLAMNVMDDLLNFKISPVQAYIKGEIQITGDFNLLKIFENLHFTSE